MIKRLQVLLSQEAYEEVENIHKKATEGHAQVKLNFSDVIDFMILNSKVSVSDLRLKHTDLRRALLGMAKQKDLSVEDIVSQLAELKNVLGKREVKKLSKPEAEANT